MHAHAFIGVVGYPVDDSKADFASAHATAWVASRIGSKT